MHALLNSLQILLKEVLERFLAGMQFPVVDSQLTCTFNFISNVILEVFVSLLFVRQKHVLVFFFSA